MPPEEEKKEESHEGDSLGEKGDEDSDVEEYKAKKISSHVSYGGDLRRLRTHEIQEFSEHDGVNIPYNC